MQEIYLNVQLVLLNVAISTAKELCNLGSNPKLGILELGHLNELRKVTFQEGTSPKLEKIIIEDCHSDLTICGISSLQSLKEILHFTRRKLVKVDRPHQNVETHGSHPLLQAEQSQSSHD